MRHLRRPLRPGEWIIATVEKWSTRPGPRARMVRPNDKGDGYCYVVDKFWTVHSVSAGIVVVRTRTGKLRMLLCGEVSMRRASWWERWLHRNRFPAMATAAVQTV